MSEDDKLDISYEINSEENRYQKESILISE
jgi:hypothetical protein